MKCQQRQEGSMCPWGKLPRFQFLFLLFLTLWPGVRYLTSLWTDCCICKMENNKSYFEVYFLSLCAILWNSAFKWVCLPFLLFLSLLFFSQLFLRPPQTAILPFCISCSWRWSWSLPSVQCHKPPFIVLQALCLPNLVPWIYTHLHCIIIRNLIYIKWPSNFPYSLQFKPEFCNKVLMIWVTVCSQSRFCWLYRAFLLWPQRT